MSLITRCPACETLFKVVPDQLRISDGWVRCGQCDEIFDASLHLLQASPEAATPQLQQTGPAAERDATDSSPEATAPADDVEPDSNHAGRPDELPVEPVLPESIPADPLTQALPGAVVDAAHDDVEPDREAELNEVTFLRDGSASALWSRPLMRATLALLSLALVLGLAGQIAFHERDRIVALQPGLKPWLLAFCESLNCTLSPPRRIESIVVDSSSFTRIRGDAYRLNFTLRNTEALALALPAIELTLTDSSDQPVVRRVFLPVELGLKSDELAAGLEWPASLAVAVKAGGDRVAGYRLLAFYP